MYTLVIRKNFNAEVGSVVWTVERSDGEPIGGAAGMAVGLNFDSLAKAESALARLESDRG